MSDFEKVYLGDGAYIEFDGYAFKLSTSNGIYDTNVIYLEPEVMTKFIDYVDLIKKKIGWI